MKRASVPLLLAAAMVVLPEPSLAVSACIWTGKWDTNYGVLEMTQAGLSVYGDYTWDEGLLHGTVSGNRFEGTWHEAPSYEGPRDAGRFAFEMAPDCLSFDGTWNYLEDDPGNSRGAWDGSRIGSAPIVQVIQVIRAEGGDIWVDGQPGPAGSVTVLTGENQIRGTADADLDCVSGVVLDGLTYATLKNAFRVRPDDDPLADWIVDVLADEKLLDALTGICSDGTPRRRDTSVEPLGFNVAQGRIVIRATVPEVSIDLTTAQLRAQGEGGGGLLVNVAPEGLTRLTALEDPLLVEPAAGGSPVMLAPGQILEATSSNVIGPYADLVARRGFE